MEKSSLTFAILRKRHIIAACVTVSGLRRVRLPAWATSRGHLPPDSQGWPRKHRLPLTPPSSPAARGAGCGSATLPQTSSGAGLSALTRRLRQTLHKPAAGKVEKQRRRESMTLLSRLRADRQTDTPVRQQGQRQRSLNDPAAPGNLRPWGDPRSYRGPSPAPQGGLGNRQDG